jgi:lysophospholipase L1-like esterase
MSLQFQGAPEKSREFSRLFAEIAENKGCHFLEAARFVIPSPVDGVHLDEGGHARLAKAIAKTLVDMVR